MRWGVVGWGVCLFFIVGCVAPPVNEKKKKDKEHPEDNEVDQQGFDVEYKRYLQEVVNVLESDDDFRQRLMKADPEDIKSGKISKDLEFVNHNVRSKLDELKRQELERLRQAAIKHYEESNGIDKKHMKIPTHLDHNNPHTFESEDLKRLIVQTTKELEDVDRQRKEEFKEYEMRKELEYEQQLKLMDEKSRAEAEKHHQKMLEKHREHKPIHHPGSKQQLEQVWEEQDHLSPEDFNPKTFFHLHDLDGNGVWDANEVKALFKKELDKMYDPNAPEDDIKERYEEMERMREHVFNETDTNRDQLISYQEFLDQTKKQEFEKDEGWDPIDQQNHPVYTEEEFKQYSQQHEEEIRHMIEQGLIPPAPPGYEYHPAAFQQGHHGPPPPHGQPMGHHQQPPIHHPQQQLHPNQMIQGGHPQGHHPQQPMQIQGHHPQQQQQQFQGGHHPQQQIAGGGYHPVPQGSHPDPAYHPQAGHQFQNAPPQQYQQQQQHHDQQFQQHHDQQQQQFHQQQQQYHAPPPQQQQQQIASSTGGQQHQIPITNSNNNVQPPVNQQTGYQQQQQQYQQAPPVQTHHDTANNNAYQQPSHPPPPAQPAGGAVPPQQHHQQPSQGTTH